MKDFYSWVDDTDDGPERDAWFETWMGANPEATTGQFIDGIAACDELDKRELTQVAQFMLLQTIRTPLGQALLRHDLQTQLRRVHEPLLRRAPGGRTQIRSRAEDAGALSSFAGTS